jgi:hypothetical protein
MQLIYAVLRTRAWLALDMVCQSRGISRGGNIKCLNSIFQLRLYLNKALKLGLSLSTQALVFPYDLSLYFFARFENGNEENTAIPD